MRLIATSCLLVAMVHGIASGDDAAAGQWIWALEKGADRAFLRTTFTMSGPAKTAIAVVSADNDFTLFLNGKKVADGKDWQQPETANVAKYLRRGKNVLAVAVRNRGGVAGFTLELRATTEDGAITRVVSDEQWRGTTNTEGDWKSVDADDSQWNPVRVIGDLGDSSLPWSNQINVSVFNDLFGGTDRSRFQPQVADNVTSPDGFQVEKVFDVPRAMGSWVALTRDGRGGLIASDQGGAGLFRILPGDDQKPTEVSRIPLDISGAQGLLWARDALYVMVNGGSASGLHRLSDTDDDGQLDHDEHLMHIQGGGEHGPHAVILGPDKKSLFVCAGNATDLPKQIAGSLIPRNWDEDLLLPRRWDANGHAAGRMAPGGWICRVDLEGKHWEVFSIGFRNEYDIALNADGELFSYDADMEWDLGSPWYRPTRVVHATSGSEFGWRSGTGKWPTYYEDSLPPVVEIGPGSPVGMVFGYGAKFPAKYQRALFVLDWTYSTIYAVHLKVRGSSYSGPKEDFVTGTPLQVTDAVIGDDGALYFTTGGRGTRSALYRVTYIGDELVTPVDAHDEQGEELRALRHRLEAEQGQENASNLKALDAILAEMGHPERFIRYAARIALETRPAEAWRNRLNELASPKARINGAIALARQGSAEDLEANLRTLNSLSASKLDEQMTLAWLRAYELSFARLGPPSDRARDAALRILDPMFPAASDSINAELVQLLVYLEAPSIIDRTLDLMDRLGPEPIPDWGYLVERHKGYGGTVGRMLEDMTPARGIHYAFVLRNVKEGWSIDQRKRYFQFFVDAATHPGGNSYAKFLSQIRDDALATCTPQEKVFLEPIASVSLVAEPPSVDPPQGPGRKWTREEALTFVRDMKKQDFNRGRNLYHAVQCAACHRLAGEGGAIGPDLSTAARKYPLPDLLDAIIEPSKAISDEYGSHQVLTVDGDVFVGRLVRLDGKLHIYTADADKPPVVIDEEDAEDISPSKISQMPTGLINALNESELRDLVAYILSGGNKRDRLYR